MAVPARPVEGAPVDVTWGGVAHDTAVAMDVQAGTFEVNFAAAVAAQVTITFPRAFASAPIVVCSSGGANLGVNNADNFYGPQARTVTPANFLARIAAPAAATTNYTLRWIAYGPRA